MAKGDDAIIRKKNKAGRKKKRNESTAVSARVAAIIATKKRRKSGKRRICEGMCFSLPTPDDPFNDRQGKPDPKRKKAKKDSHSQAIQKVSATKTDKASKNEATEKDSLEEDEEQKVTKTVKESKNENMQLPIAKPNGVKTKMIKKCGLLSAQYGKAHMDSDFPSKFLILCLSSIQNALLNDSRHCENIKELFVSRWGIEFWKCYSANMDILETTGGCSNEEQISWMVSSAADMISRKEKEGLSIAYPFLLYIVPSRERASKVRSVCKPLKALGIHTVSLHSGASLDHQVHGLKSCEPEFLVSTPERLLELVTLKATDISGVSLLVVDGLETLCKDGHLDTIKSIRQHISASTNTVVFSESFSPASAQAVQHLSVGSFYRLSLNNSVASHSAFISQSVHVCSSEEEKLSKVLEVLELVCIHGLPLKALCIVHNDCEDNKLIPILKEKGYHVSADWNHSNSEVESSATKLSISVVDMDHIKSTDLAEVEFVILYQFIPTIDNYTQIITRMARHSTNGALHCVFSKENDSALAGPLVKVLEQCGQEVPQALRSLCETTSPMLEQ